jgi:hypothetical protein
MMFVRRNAKPMNVRKTNAVKATPSSVEDSGDEAAAGYALKFDQMRAFANGT